MQDRRQFLKGIGLFTILAGAGRVWKANRELILPNPDYVIAPYEMVFFQIGQPFLLPFHNRQQPNDLAFLIHNYGTEFPIIVCI